MGEYKKKKTRKTKKDNKKKDNASTNSATKNRTSEEKHEVTKEKPKRSKKEKLSTKKEANKTKAEENTKTSNGNREAGLARKNKKPKEDLPVTEPLCASSRMKGGSATKIILDVICSKAVQQVYVQTKKSVERRVGDCIQSYKDAYFACYENVDDIGEILKSCGKSLQEGRHIYWLGGGTAGILGFIDSSEMPDTYGAPFDETRAFCNGGWGPNDVMNFEGDLSSKGKLFRISFSLF